MNIAPNHDGFFDEEATQLMGAAFDQACTSLGRFGCSVAIREIVAKRIVEAAKNGERNPLQLHRLAVKPFSTMPLQPAVPAGSIGRNPPVPVYASITCIA